MVATCEEYIRKLRSLAVEVITGRGESDEADVLGQALMIMHSDLMLLLPLA